MSVHAILGVRQRRIIQKSLDIAHVSIFSIAPDLCLFGALDPRAISVVIALLAVLAGLPLGGGNWALGQSFFGI